MKCDKCGHSRMVVSENGFHNVCCLSNKEQMKCLTGEKDRFDDISLLFADIDTIIDSAGGDGNG